MRVIPESLPTLPPTEPSGRSQYDHVLEELFRAHWDRVYSICLRMLRDPQEAADATQDAFVRALRHLSRADDPVAYLVTTARSVSIDRLRRAGREIELTETTGGAATSAGQTIDAAEIAVRRVVLRVVWKRLSAREKLLVTMSFAGFSADEIAARASLTVPAAKKALERARERARRAAGLPGLVFATLMLRRRLWARLNGGREDASLRLSSLTATAVFVVALAGLHPGQVANTVGKSPEMGPGPVMPSTNASPAIQAAANSGIPGRATEVASTGTPRPGALESGADTGPLGAILPPDSDPGHAEFRHLTPSPNFSTDHTVFAVGLEQGSIMRCPQLYCPVLFRTQNGGSSWRRLSAIGLYGGGPIVLPAAYPVDPAIYAQSDYGLQRSDDGGQTFRIAVPELRQVRVAVAPPSTTADGTLALGGDQPLVYREGSGKVSAVTGLPPGTFVHDLLFAGVDDLVLVGNVLSGDAVYNCHIGGSCSPIVASGDDRFGLLPAPPASAVSYRILRAGGQPLAVSDDAGVTFRPLATPPGEAEAVGSTWFGTPSTSRGGGLMAWDIGRKVDEYRTAWQFWLSDPAAPNGFRPSGSGMMGWPLSDPATLVMLPDGRAIEAVTQSPDMNRWGFLCSPDGGLNWTPACASP
jgi:RNA polymerase sigma-70 factor (ECF subfamily)